MRCIQNKFQNKSLSYSFGYLLGLTILSICSSRAAFAVILAEPKRQSRPMAEEFFPESRFGSGPIRKDAEDEYELDGPSRKPAGLEFSDGSGRVQPTLVIPDGDMPVSQGNLNPKPSDSARSGVQEVALIASDLGFFPKTLFVTKDTPVKIFATGASTRSLCVMIDSFQVRKQVKSQKVVEISFTPTQVGQYRFHCPINGMEGTILVKDTASRNLGSWMQPASQPVSRQVEPGENSNERFQERSGKRREPRYSKGD